MGQKGLWGLLWLSLVTPPLLMAATQVAPKKVPTPTKTRPVPKPPKQQGVEWLKLPFEKAENEVLRLVFNALPEIEKITKNSLLYEVKTAGQLPPSYSQNFRLKLEKVLLKAIQLKHCPQCQQSRLIQRTDGTIRFESQSTELSRARQMATKHQVDKLIFAELDYHPLDLKLRLKILDVTSGNLVWLKQFSTKDVVSSKKNRFTLNDDSLLEGDSLSRVLIGEIAFTTVLSTGVALLPTIDTSMVGGGGASIFYPFADVLIGEKYDRGRQRFGFSFGGILTLKEPEIFSGNEPLPFALRIGAQYRYTFNPYTQRNPHFSMIAEGGALFSTGLVTGYAGAGLELLIMKRFSVSALPTYVIPATVKGEDIITPTGDGNYETTQGPDKGSYGGLGLIVKGSINW